ncbi:hypothetical protein BH24DEI2_BH24DEI2_20030 [soil metagenome]
MTKRAKKPEPKRAVRLSVLAGVCVLALTGLLFSVYGVQTQDTLKVGEPSPKTFRAPVATEVTDPILTESERQVARGQVETIFSTDATVQRLVVNAVTAAGLPEEVETLLVAAYRRPGGVNEARRQALIQEAVTVAPQARQQEVRLLLERRLLTTSAPSITQTKAAQDTAAAAVKPVLQTLKAGQIIVREGDALSEDQLRVLEALGLYNARTDVVNRQLRVFLSCLLVALLLSLPLLYATRRLNTLAFEQLGFLVALTLVALAAQRLAFFLNPHFLFVFLLPILVAVLVSEFAGVLWAVWLAVAVGLLDPGSALFTVLTVLGGGLAASVLARQFKTRTSLLLAGGVSGLVGALSFGLLLLLYGTTPSLATLYNLLFVVGGGLVAGTVALGLLPLAENAFDFLTEFRLTELSNPSSPLLQRLLLEAPGTYQHSLIISNLVEQAVTNIGGDALLARVGALYHDVGKLKRPQFFVENQFSGDNPHNTLSPHLSYLIIINHVRDGIELLREYKLPKRLEAFAGEHHGTTVLSYFYKRALEDSAKLDELNFRYPGPRPQSKETAVLMIADAVESASRTLSEPSQGSIRALIDRLIELRQQDGQLADSPLNFHNLEVIASTFERMLTGILHRRISYPTSEEIQSLKRGDRTGVTNPGVTNAGDTQRNPAVSTAGTP